LVEPGRALIQTSHAKRQAGRHRHALAPCAHARLRAARGAQHPVRPPQLRARLRGSNAQLNTQASDIPSPVPAARPRASEPPPARGCAVAPGPRLRAPSRLLRIFSSAAACTQIGSPGIEPSQPQARARDSAMAPHTTIRPRLRSRRPCLSGAAHASHSMAAAISPADAPRARGRARPAPVACPLQLIAARPLLPGPFAPNRSRKDWHPHVAWSAHFVASDRRFSRARSLHAPLARRARAGCSATSSRRWFLCYLSHACRKLQGGGQARGGRALAVAGGDASALAPDATLSQASRWRCWEGGALPEARGAPIEERPCCRGATSEAQAAPWAPSTLNESLGVPAFSLPGVSLCAPS
jgi:hypothetical protein